jgi:hypothetical protein
MPRNVKLFQQILYVFQINVLLQFEENYKSKNNIYTNNLKIFFQIKIQ